MFFPALRRARTLRSRASGLSVGVGSLPRRTALLLAALLATASAPSAQDFYDTTVLRTVDLAFHDVNYWALLVQNYASQTNILADMTVNGVTYPNVGVRFRGNTSYTALPPGSQKMSFNIDVEFVHAGQAVMGHDSLNFNNSFHDPTFCREVVYNNFIAQYIPNGRANHINLTLNGQNWGVYANVQQYGKDVLRQYFADEDGLRIKCANNPNGPGLRYNGPLQSGYTGYEIKHDGGLVDPWGALIAVCNSVTNEPLGTWQNIDTLFAIDPSSWSVSLENLFSDDDSYVNKGADFTLYRDPADGRMHLHQTDANETFTITSWSPFLNFTAANKPVLSHVLAVPELRQRYLAHYRAAKLQFSWTHFEPIFTAHRNLIDAAVQADPKKLYTYQAFVNNFTTTVNLGGGLGGGNVVGLQQFFTNRLTTLNANAELVAQGPDITAVQASATEPVPTDTVWITAAVSATTSAVASVELYYLPTPGSYSKVSMQDDGLSGDGGAGDGVYGAVLPVVASSGQKVKYYVAATSANTFASKTFNPHRSEIAPYEVNYTFGQAGMRITEYMYQGANGEFLELTNTTNAPIDLTGWSFDDDSAVPGTFSLTAAGIVQPGQSILVTDANPVTFAAAWGLAGVTILGPNTVSALGRNDQINVYDQNGDLVERLTYGDETFPGSIRTQTKSGQICSDALGEDDPYAYVLAALGDAYGSHASAGNDLGTPGTFTSVSCHEPIGLSYCLAGVNVSGTTALISAVGSTAVLNQDITLSVAGANPNTTGVFFFGPTQVQVPFWNGFRCAGAPIRRIYPTIVASPTGDVSRTLDFGLPYGAFLLPGTTANFQLWYRDGGSANLSDAVRIDLH